MGAYEYQALDDGGRTRRGVWEGDSPRHVRDQLRERGLTPLEVRAVSGRAGGESRRAAGLSITTAERALVLRQLATLARAGLPLEEALGTVAEQSGRGSTAVIFTTLRSSVREGLDLAEGMRAFPRAFPDEVLAAVAAGERSGALEAVLERLADFAEKRQGLGREIMLALLYPLIVVAVALGVVAAMMTTVVPRVVRVFEHADRELPVLTRVLITSSEFLSANAPWLVLASIALAAACAFSVRHERVRAGLQGILLRIPVLGRALRAAATARFCRSLALQVASDVPLVDALRVSAETTALVAMRRQVLEAARGVREGGSFAAEIAADAVFPPLVVRLLASGEQTGRLSEMLDRAAESQESEAGALARTFSALLQPLMILVVGLFVLLVVLAVMLPILDLNQLVS
jgi:general secretion pathway protein F